MKIGFLFNHDAGHQAAHLSPVVEALAKHRPDYELVVFASDPAFSESVRRALPEERLARVVFIDLTLPPGVGTLAKLLDAAMPASRVARLAFHATAFKGLDALVAPERTCLFLKRVFAVKGVKFVHVRHGAGDRAIGFHPSFKEFDLLLLQGEKYRRRLIESGGLDGNDYALIGYPKFDLVNLNQPRRRLFDNDNPVVFYNPHFSPDMSSWNAMGAGVLDYFARHKELNLIFAPHVMLFKKRVHISPGSFRIMVRHDIPEKYIHCDNILIDVDSPRLFDMTYTLNSDLYLADISSQVIEFLARPRPCVFLNPRRIDWRGREDFAAWRLGDVIEDLDALGPAISKALAEPNRYEAAQKAHFADTFDLTDEPSSTRAAKAIAAFMECEAGA